MSANTAMPFLQASISEMATFEVRPPSPRHRAASISRYHAVSACPSGLKLTDVCMIGPRARYGILVDTLCCARAVRSGKSSGMARRSCRNRQATSKSTHLLIETWLVVVCCLTESPGIVRRSYRIAQCCPRRRWPPRHRGAVFSTAETEGTFSGAVALSRALVFDAG